jgi:hypothetical protein
MPRVRPIPRDLYRADIAQLRPGHCAVCGVAGTADAPLIVLAPQRDRAVRIELHAACQPAWYRKRGVRPIRAPLISPPAATVVRMPQRPPASASPASTPASKKTPDREMKLINHVCADRSKVHFELGTDFLAVLRIVCKRRGFSIGDLVEAVRKDLANRRSKTPLPEAVENFVIDYLNGTRADTVAETRGL